MKFRDTNAQQGAELELAPMVDVVFLLLIFFIVTWQFARFERDMDISVPAAEETTDEPRNVGEIIVNVRTDGSIVLNGLEVSEEELLAKLKSISQAYPDQAVILRGSSEANFQAIINVLDEIKKAGIWNVAFATTNP
ncbi:biopolymer transporter ExbD [Verrucomicrobiales bacterium]|jgi:biopolymer transport protein ExbD|nr:biopolymer transporter ExbD [Verrucomicrobiales bacterium]MDA9922597.1 biopolymer transporter ExbD [Verrucomicrobiales bacterium]